MSGASDSSRRSTGGRGVSGATCLRCFTLRTRRGTSPYVVYGASLASELDVLRLGGSLAAFFLGTGIASHALDELHSRPLGTHLNSSVLLALGVGGLAGSVAVAVAGAFIISPWTLAWAAVGVLLATGYVLEWHRLLHTDLAFGLAWGGFPVLVGFWAQAEQFGIAALIVALMATPAKPCPARPEQNGSIRAAECARRPRTG